jgi:hypothetical protein
MSTNSEIASAIRRVKEGDENGVETIWGTFFPRLVRFARGQLEVMPREVRDSEGVALSAVHSCCRRMKAGRFQHVTNQHELWKLLVAITARKACANRRYEFAKKRDARRTKRENVLLGADGEGEPRRGLDGLAVDRAADWAKDVAETCEHLLGCLDEKSRSVALLTLEGYSAKEIAKRLDCVDRTVERKLARIRDKWTRMGFGPEQETCGHG